MIMQTPKIDLYPHNQETYDRIIEMWKTSNRVAVIQATGTGKTYLMLRCMVDFEPSKKVVLAPSNYILDQLLSKANGNLPNTELLTYAKLAFMTKEEIADLNPSLIVLDEFHRCGADKWELGVDMLIKMFPNAKILGTSATPIRYLDNARDMSDELFEGNIAVNLSLSDAIVKGILPMPKYISALYTFDEEINNLQAKIEKSKNDEETKKEYLKEVDALKNKLNKSKGIPEILKKHITDFGGKFIVFCKDKRHLNEMESTVISWFKKAKIGKKIESYRVTSGEIENNKEMLSFRENSNSENVRLLFSIDMLNEGVHVEDITGVILLRPTISPIIYYQQIGRSIQAGNSINPLILDFVNNFNNVRVKSFLNDLTDSMERESSGVNFDKDNSVYIPEFTVIDETKDVSDLFSLIESSIILDWDMMFSKYLDCDGDVYKSEEFYLMEWARYQRSYYARGVLREDRVEKLNSVGFAWNTFENKWDSMFEKLERYYEINGNSDIDISMGKDLLNWCKHQRQDKSYGKILEDRIQRLEGVNFNWGSPRGKKISWDGYFNLLKEYKKIYGTSSVNYHGEINNIRIGGWVRVQRNKYNKGILEEERINKLKNIGFEFDPNRAKWDEQFNELVKYRNTYGNVDVKYKFVVNKIKLGAWVSTQRYHRNIGTLSIERIDKLNAIGMSWTIDKEDKPNEH